jgi:hypothetical protein
MSQRRVQSPKLTLAWIVAVAWGCSSATMDEGNDGADASGGSATGGASAAGGASGGGGVSSDGGLSGGAGSDGGASDGGGGVETGGRSTSGDGGASDGGDSSEGGGSPGSGGAPVGTCGDPPLEVMGPAVETSKLVDVPLPPAQGGPLVDGIYDATTQVFYGEFNLDALVGGFRQVIRVREGGTMMDWFSISGGPQSFSFSVVPSGPNLDLTPVCPNPSDASGPQPYKAAPGQLQMYVDYGSTTAIVTHVLRD